MGNREPRQKKGYSAEEKLFIQGTNDSSIVSKHSVESLYPPTKGKWSYFEPFIAVGQARRRSPIINRGYWLRMQCVEHAVRSFLAETRQLRKRVIVNLGCGFDPLPFQFLSAKTRKNTLFIDIDYPDLISIKARRVAENTRLKSFIRNLQVNEVPKGTSDVYLRSDEYLAVGCDLEQLTWLNDFFQNEGLLKADILFTAEVSITYMRTRPANALISWAASLPNARFSLLEQIMPDGPENAFARTMLKHFNTLRTPLQSVQTYPTIQRQVGRFIKAGWSKAQATDLLGFWSNLIDNDQKQSVWNCEAFDEWEEFFIFSQHYCFLYASNSGQSDILNVSNSQGGEIYSSFQISEKSESVPQISKNFCVKSCAPFRRRFGALQDVNIDTITYLGGLGSAGRSSEHTQISPGYAINGNPFSVGQFRARMCHTLNKIDNDRLVLFGGRVGPGYSLGDTWIFSENEWRCWEYYRAPGQIVPLGQNVFPLARFRHCAFSNEKTGQLLVYGGVGDNNKVLGDWYIFHPDTGWSELSLATRNQEPGPRFAAATCTLPDGTALMSGGIDANGKVLDEIWRIEWPDNGIVTVEQLDIPMPQKSLLKRFGAQLVYAEETDEILLIGGVSGGSLLKNHETIVVLQLSKAGIFVKETLGFDSPEPPLLVGFSAKDLRGAVMIVGGGAVCFSFGSEWNEHILLVGKDAGKLNIIFKEAEKQGRTGGTIEAGAPASAQSESESASAKDKNTSKPPAFKKKKGSSLIIPRVRVSTEEEFLKVMSRDEPVLLEGIDFGTCVKRWDWDYLKSAVGLDRDVIVHASANSQMSFTSKNFTYEKMPFGEFIDEITERRPRPKCPKPITTATTTSITTTTTAPTPLTPIIPITPTTSTIPTHTTTDTSSTDTATIPPPPPPAAEEKPEKRNLYLRSISCIKPNSEPATLRYDFPTLAKDFTLPPSLSLVSQSQHSSPLRISSSNIGMWLHFDVMANILFHVGGSKRFRIWHPKEVTKLQFPPGSSSSTIEDPFAIEGVVGETGVGGDEPERGRFWEVILKPGMAVYIPPMFPHAAKPLTPCVAVNVFFRNLEYESYAPGKDVYGNKDLAAYEKGRGWIKKMVKEFEGLPKTVRRFYLERLAEEVMASAKEEVEEDKVEEKRWKGQGRWEDGKEREKARRAFRDRNT